MLFVLLWLAVGAAIVADVFDKLPLENAVGRFIGMTILPHGVMIVGLCVEYDVQKNGTTDWLGVGANWRQ